MPGSGEVDEWITDIEMTLGHINKTGVKTGSICRVPEEIREANKEKSNEWYRPKFVAMGPIHRGATIDLQTMELTKWRFMDGLLGRPTTRRYSLIRESCKEIKGLESIIRASYGDTIHMETEEFARNMLLDACFLLELLLRLSENETIPSDLGYMYDYKKMSRLLTDLMLLENQVPFLLLTILSLVLVVYCDNQQEFVSRVAIFELGELSPKKIAESLGCNVASADSANDVCHFLHLIHLCSPDPYQHQDILGKHPLQLHRCVRKLQAFGITISARPTIYHEGNNLLVAVCVRPYSV